MVNYGSATRAFMVNQALNVRAAMAYDGADTRYAGAIRAIRREDVGSGGVDVRSRMPWRRSVASSARCAGAIRAIRREDEGAAPPWRTTAQIAPAHPTEVGTRTHYCASVNSILRQRIQYIAPAIQYIAPAYAIHCASALRSAPAQRAGVADGLAVGCRRRLQEEACARCAGGVRVRAPLGGAVAGGAERR
jgi:hypothetical protein